MLKNNVFAVILFSLLCSLSVGAEVRTWTSGKFTVEAELIGVSEDGQSITLRRSDNGKEITLPLEKISERDQGYVEGQKKIVGTTKSTNPTSGSKAISVTLASGKGQRRALLIGVNDYEDLTPLKFCEADATALRDALVKLGFQSGDIKLLTTETGTKNQPTRLNIEEHLDALFAGLSENDMVLISLSGHGGQFIYRGSDGRTKEESFFCPKDARTHQPDRTMISTQKIYDRLEKCPAKFKLLLIDACRDEHLVPKSEGGKSGSLDESRAIAGFSKSLADMKLPKGTFALISCAAKEKSYESPKLQQGVFMYHVVEGALGKADADGDSIVTLFELRNYVIQQTTNFVFREFDRRKQNPFFHSHFETADFGLFDVSKLGSQAKPAIPLGPVTQYPGLDGTSGKLLRVFGETNPLNIRNNFSVYRVAYSPNGAMIASAGSDNVVRIWNVLTGEQISSISHTGSLSSVCFSPSSQLLLSTTQNGTAKISKADSGELVGEANAGRWTIYHGIFSQDELSYILGTGGDSYRGEMGQANAAHLFRINSKKPVRSFVGHKNSVTSVAMSPDGSILLTGSSDNMLGLWDTQTGKSIKILGYHDGGIDQVEFSPDGRLALSLSIGDKTLKIWNIETGNEIRSFTDPKQNLRQAAFSPSGKTVVAYITDLRYAYSYYYGGDENTFKFWDLSTGKERGSFDSVLYRIRQFALSPDGQTMAIGGHGDGEPTSQPKLQLLSTGLKE